MNVEQLQWLMNVKAACRLNFRRGQCETGPVVDACEDCSAV